MNFPSWWNVKARQATRLRECGLFTTRALILAARQEDDDGPVADHVPVSIRVRDLYTFCNTSLAHLNVNLSLVSQEEGLRVCGKKRNAVLIHEPPTPVEYGWTAEDLERYPPECYCPITTVLFHDPVVAADGITYERDYIQQWLEHHDTSPMTNQALFTKLLFPNVAIRQTIDRLT
jgi:hypothetical protein